MNKNELYLWGTTKYSIAESKALLDGGYYINAFIDNNKEKQGKSIHGIKIRAFEKIKPELSAGESAVILLTSTNSCSIYQILEQLVSSGVPNDIGIIKARAARFGWKPDLSQDEYTGEIIWYRKSGQVFRVFTRLEINLIDGCNLNCKGCTHFSSIYPLDSVYPLDLYREDLLKFRAAGKMLRLRLLGGEPLLVKNLEEYILLARDIFPEADIELVTNGILFPSLPQSLLKLLSDDKISVVISPYLPTMKMADKIESCLNSKAVNWAYDGDTIQEFSRALTLQPVHSARDACKACASSQCTFLRNGRLFKCPPEALIHDLAKHYSLELPFSDVGCGEEIAASPDALLKQVMRLATEPVKLCRYCEESPEKIPWSIKNHPALKDWLYQDGR